MMTYQESESVLETIPVSVPGHQVFGSGSVLSRFEPRHTFRTMSGDKICVCSADFSQVRRYTDFCLVEAVVHVVFMVHPSSHPISISLLTNVPIASACANGSYRQSLVRKAINVSLMSGALEMEEVKLTA